MIVEMKLKAGIKQATQGLGSGILQPANCNLESFKAWQAYNRFTQGVPLNKCKGKEQVAQRETISHLRTSIFK